jgi:folate-binding protein YgfZ
MQGSDLDALDAGRAFVELRGWRAVAVTGTDAVGWLHDLVTADVAGLAPSRACRALLLSPTGRIRADVHVLRRAHDLLLLQRREQPEPVEGVLDRYRLSSDVRLADATVAVIAVPGDASQPPDLPDRLDRTLSVPSVLGGGADVVVPEDGRHEARLALSALGLVEVGEEAAEVRRILRGDPRMGADFGADALPAEVGLDDTVDTTKGCFLGQESVAKVRNLGHPPRLLRHVLVDGAVRAGDVVLAGRAPVGEVTSGVTIGGRSTALIRIGWDAREAAWTLADGRPLLAVPRPA